MFIEVPRIEKINTLRVDDYKKYLLELSFINARIFNLAQKRYSHIVLSDKIKDKKCYLQKHYTPTDFERSLIKRVKEITQVLLISKFDNEFFAKEVEIKNNSLIKLIVHNPYEDVEQFLVVSDKDEIINTPWNCYAMYGARVKFVKPKSALEKFLIGKRPLDIINLNGKTGGLASIIYSQSLE